MIIVVMLYTSCFVNTIPSYSNGVFFVCKNQIKNMVFLLVKIIKRNVARHPLIRSHCLPNISTTY
jgi:hypothetical protein